VIFACQSLPVRSPLLRAHTGATCAPYEPGGHRSSLLHSAAAVSAAAADGYRESLSAKPPDGSLYYLAVCFGQCQTVCKSAFRLYIPNGLSADGLPLPETQPIFLIGAGTRLLRKRMHDGAGNS
jgi:hypothetical protein